jgi:hypothetical protein
MPVTTTIVMLLYYSTASTGLPVSAHVGCSAMPDLMEYVSLIAIDLGMCAIEMLFEYLL